MREAEVPKDEDQRLSELRALGLLDTPPEERFDRITRMAQRLFDVPVALVSLVDEDRQWFKSRQGFEVTETPRSVSFCAHALDGREVLFVEDARRDERFLDNPLVTGDPSIRFYAGAPISGPDGSPLGTLCVIDRQPRRLTPDDRRTLEDLAEMIEDEIAFTRMAIADELTGLSNRRGLTFLGRQVLAVCTRQKVPAVLMFGDLDNLKRINDENGHEAGDAAIAAVAAALSTTFRRADVLARVGGDEFAALLTGTDSVDEPVDRLREELASRRIEPDEPLSLSLGCAVFDPARPVDLSDLMAAADAAMYEDKLRRKAAADLA